MCTCCSSLIIDCWACMYSCTHKHLWIFPFHVSTDTYTHCSTFPYMRSHTSPSWSVSMFLCVRTVSMSTLFWGVEESGWRWWAPLDARLVFTLARPHPRGPAPVRCWNRPRPYWPPPQLWAEHTTAAEQGSSSHPTDWMDTLWSEGWADLAWLTHEY